MMSTGLQRPVALPGSATAGHQHHALVPARRPARRATTVVCKAAGGEVLVAGATGQTAARISLQLARAGYKVTAGGEG